MSQIGMAGFGTSSFVIGAHADHKTSDYFFPRVQSLELRDVPWEKRLKPVRSYSQIATYAAVLVLAASVTFAFI